jgi:hypothetical protein
VKQDGENEILPLFAVGDDHCRQIMVGEKNVGSGGFWKQDGVVGILLGRNTGVVSASPDDIESVIPIVV